MALDSRTSPDSRYVNFADSILGPPLARGQHADTALMFEGGAVTYAELENCANRAGNALASLGVRLGDRVLLVVSDRPEFYYVYLGLLKIGAIPVALNLRLSAGDLERIFNDSGARVVVTDMLFFDIVSGAAENAATPPQLIVSDDRAPGALALAEIMAGASDVLDSIPRLPDDPAFWMYTSGTTGQPKAAIHCQRTIDVADGYLGEVLGVGPGDRVFCSSKLFFAFAFSHCFISAMRLGATAVLYSGWPTVEAIADLVAEHRPTVLLSVPTFFRNLLASGAADGEAFKAVRHYISAGEKLPASLFDRWQAKTGQPIKDGVGATETCFLFLANRGGEYRPGSCGVPTPGTEVKLIDERGDLVTEADHPGIMWVKMRSVAAGYWNRDENTRVAFNDGWYCTGDMFTRDKDGWYSHEGRGDDMLKISGQWVSPAEIEEHVLKIPGVDNAAVVGVPNEDGLIRLALFLVAPQGSTGTEALETEIRETLTSNLSIYKCPRRVFFVDDLPVTGSGKVRRFQLREMAERHAGG
jgi:benzoate-CoA ligase family protein